MILREEQKMLIPDCRNDENYNEDFLTGEDKEFVRGYDWATEMAVDNFFDNNFAPDMPPMEEDGELTTMLTKELPTYLQKTEEVSFTFGDREPETREIKTYADLLRSRMLDWIEAHRDELITSMIDDMDDDIYEAIRNKVLKENEAKENPKEYKDTRKMF